MTDGTSIKAIETVYNGYRFRSRLEARWAVFFDALGWEFEYEKEGFELGKAGRYLPDFHLVKSDIWVEVKPNRQLSAKEKNKILWLAHYAKRPVIVVRGAPWPDNLAAHYEDKHRDGGCVVEHFDTFLAPCPCCGGLTTVGTATDPQVMDALLRQPSLLAACNAARQARFEFGECGAR